ncbi:molecular chaperone HtpG [Candidatus Tachikawaea gelatinosa]|uniref:Chaperone protein HtpG n=1 Tax=Candidatus Tachikawaea gelatinosa TaxID=1410383 RepID=A0A090AML5_9ENTR|nr:molecular chaperone HtpG [Candidatus Tachikawaea gelatinosa]BAP58834.1 chaperone protein HtpG [Candidatus Tachikawaea gelatinosa]
MTQKETYNFQSEVKQLLKLMIHSLYSNKEIFLRELISNASDAADKLRFLALSNPSLYENDTDLCVKISLDKKNCLIKISDNGIGMKKKEVIENLGTIAKSGTKNFLESLKTESENKNAQLIGKFGVGFYSAFIVSDKVSLHTRAANVSADESVLWQSTGEGEYTLTQKEKKKRGTEIVLHIKKSEKEFLDVWRLKSIISKYSDHISLPVKMEMEDEKTKLFKWEQVNKAQAIWTRKKSEISIKEYKDFYTSITNDSVEPIIWTHNHVEGKQEYIVLLYIPSNTPWDLFHRDNKHGLKLYIQRVFIMDDTEQLLPNYLRFVKGIVDSNDLPLNISREILQENHLISNLKLAITKRILHILEKLSKDDNEKYQKFWNTFGLVFKEGAAEEHINKKEFMNLLRFSSTYQNNPEQNVSLADYISRTKKDQKNIYYITADNYISAKNSPHLEQFKQKNIEVLLLSDRIDEWMISYFTDFENKSFKSVSKIDKDLEKIDKENLQDNKKNQEKEFAPFLQIIEKQLKNRVKKVKLTYALTKTPSILTTDTEEMSTQMAKLFKAAGQAVPDIKYIFNINPQHILIKHIIKVSDKVILKDWIELLFEEALLAEKGTLEDTNKFINRVNRLLFP